MDGSDVSCSKGSRSETRSVLWWGRFDPDYSRNRILQRVLEGLGWSVVSFSPRVSRFGDLEAFLTGVSRPDLVWVPCFRQRDISAASRFSRRHHIPLVVDPLISAYDKRVFERQILVPASPRAKRLLKWERDLLKKADCLLADTQAHANFYHEVLGVDLSRIFVVPVGAEESLFKPVPAVEPKPEIPVHVLFYGSFIPLQGPQVIVDAALRYCGPPVEWHLVGDGPLLDEVRQMAENHPAIIFEPWVPYEKLPERIGRADLVLGIFGTTLKAGRVVPNKVYQAAACGRPVVTMGSGAYPEEMSNQKESGFFWTRPGDAQGLANAVAELAGDPAGLPRHGLAARRSYEKHLSVKTVRSRLAAALGQFEPPTNS